MQKLVEDCRVMKEYNLRITREALLTLMDTRKVSRAMIEQRLNEQRKSEIAPVIASIVIFILMILLYIGNRLKEREVEIFFALSLFLCQILIMTYLIGKDRENKLLSEILTVIGQ
jgi:hypothetical protein